MGFHTTHLQRHLLETEALVISLILLAIPLGWSLKHIRRQVKFSYFALFTLVLANLFTGVMFYLAPAAVGVTELFPDYTQLIFSHPLRYMLIMIPLSVMFCMIVLVPVFNKLYLRAYSLPRNG